MQTNKLQFDSLMDTLIGLPLVKKQEIFHILKRNIAEEKQISINKIIQRVNKHLNRASWFLVMR